MSLNVETVGSVNVVTLEGRLVTEVAQQLKGDFDDLAARMPAVTVLDMSRVGFMSSYLVGVLVALYTRLAEKGLSVHLAGLDARQRLVLKVSDLERYFTFHDNREEALAALGVSSTGS